VRGWGDGVGVMAGAGERPGDEGVRVSHLAGLVLVASPGGGFALLTRSS
jgi:hypothetical protein